MLPSVAEEIEDHASTVTDVKMRNDSELQLEDLRKKRRVFFMEFCTNVTLHGFAQICLEKGKGKI